MLNDFGDSKVTVKKDELLAALRTNRANHVTTFEEAKVGYTLKLRAHFLAQLELLNFSPDKLDEVKRSVTFAEPIDRRKDYDLVIKMLEMSTADEISVSQTQFSQYVMDDWSWSRDVNFTNVGLARRK